MKLTGNTKRVNYIDYYDAPSFAYSRISYRETYREKGIGSL